MAGGFYPADRTELAAQVQRFLAQAQAPIGGRPLAIVAPHAGYAYCGRILGEAWRQAAGQDYDLVVILGTNHRVAGLDAPIVWPDGAWRTPLGTVAVDAAAARALLAADPECRSATAPHATEHSLEVQLPFAQTVFPRLPILPVMVATQDPAKCERLGRALAAALRGRRPLIVASSDLSHYPAAADAERIDRATLAAIAAARPGRADAGDRHRDARRRARAGHLRLRRGADPRRPGRGRGARRDARRGRRLRELGAGAGRRPAARRRLRRGRLLRRAAARPAPTPRRRCRRPTAPCCCGWRARRSAATSTPATTARDRSAPRRRSPSRAGRSSP